MTSPWDPLLDGRDDELDTVDLEDDNNSKDLHKVESGMDTMIQLLNNGGLL